MINEEQHILSVVAEECAEIAQRVSKALRFGLREVQPGQERTNADRILLEYYDLMGAIDLLQARGLLVINADEMLKKISEKKAKVEHYMEYARSIGALE